MKWLIATLIAAGLTTAALDAYLPAIDRSERTAAVASLRGVERDARTIAFISGSPSTADGVPAALAETVIPDGTTITLEDGALVRRTEDSCYRLELTDTTLEGEVSPC